jgi:hypothetical protein
MTNQINQGKLYQQWYRFIEEHGFRWKGILTRYKGDGNLSETLNSTRQFTPAEDASTIEHYLCFINQEDPSKVTERKFILEKCGPTIIHPIDPKATIMFSSHGSGLMSRSLSEEETNYAEIYLNIDNRRISAVISYDKDNYMLSRISLFREVKQRENKLPWSEDKATITNRKYPDINVVNTFLLSSDTVEESILNNYVVNWGQENRLIFDFPDNISLNIPQILNLKNREDLILSWQYNNNEIKRAIVKFNDHNRSPDLITQDCVIL